MDKTVSEPRPSRPRQAEPILAEIAWEVCNQVGGIYTVLRSKAPAMVAHWGRDYFLIGPYNRQTASVEFEPDAGPGGPLGEAVRELQASGIGAHYGRWIVTGRPQIILLEHGSVFSRLGDVKYRLWSDHQIATPSDDQMINGVVAFGEACRQLLWILAQSHERNPSFSWQITAHFHEWMAGAAIPMLRQDRWPGAIVFTTHATVLGRSLAMNDPGFYDHLPFVDADSEAKRFNVQAQHGIERAAVHGSHVFTTVSDVAARECTHLLGRAPDVLLPNGLNIERFAVLHEFQNLHRRYKEQIHEFTVRHFFPSYTFDLENTLYFFTSGRYEYRNKGMDMTVEALARLNHRLRGAPRAVTVVAFIITRRPTRNVHVDAFETLAMYKEFQDIVEHIKKDIGEGLMLAAARGQIPNLNLFLQEYWRLRLHRAIHAWKREQLPSIVTHELVDDTTDEVLNQLRSCGLWNQPENPVKVVYHPDFVTATSPLFAMDYDQFVRGCHLGVFPSYYEPWGYTPLESIALGVPAITSDLAGFGSYVTHLLPDHEDHGLFVVRRRGRSFDEATEDLVNAMYAISQLDRRERIGLRNRVESASNRFGWDHLVQYYHEAHELAADRIG